MYPGWKVGGYPYANTPASDVNSSMSTPLVISETAYTKGNPTCVDQIQTYLDFVLPLQLRGAGPSASSSPALDPMLYRYSPEGVQGLVFSGRDRASRRRDQEGHRVGLKDI